MSTCAVKSCKNNSVNCKAQGKVVQFYRVPKDPVIQQGWMTACGIETFKVSSRVCSVHFQTTDFQIGSKRGKLIDNAIPSANLVITQVPST